MLETVLYGAVTRGTNKATLLLINLCLIGCILVCSTLIFLPLHLPPELTPHIVGLLLLAIALQLSINWLVAETGVVSPEQQQRELFGPVEGGALAGGHDRAANEQAAAAQQQPQCTGGRAAGGCDSKAKDQ